MDIDSEIPVRAKLILNENAPFILLYTMDGDNEISLVKYEISISEKAEVRFGKASLPAGRYSMGGYRYPESTALLRKAQKNLQGSSPVSVEGIELSISPHKSLDENVSEFFLCLLDTSHYGAKIELLNCVLIVKTQTKDVLGATRIRLPKNENGLLHQPLTTFIYKSIKDSNEFAKLGEMSSFWKLSPFLLLDLMKHCQGKPEEKFIAHALIHRAYVAGKQQRELNAISQSGISIFPGDIIGDGDSLRIYTERLAQSKIAVVFQPEAEPFYIIVCKNAKRSALDMLKYYGKNLLIFSEDGFIDHISGKKTSHEDENGHLALQYLLKTYYIQEKKNESFFVWPQTCISPSTNKITDADWNHFGVLHYMGYTVGKKSLLSPDERKNILSQIYLDELKLPPQSEFSLVVAQWGEPRESLRLKKMANTIASLARNKKRENIERFTNAIAEWEEDLAWLKVKYYDGVYDQEFQWPSCNA